ncbi:MAG: ATP-binding cassette domain-containing protein [Ruminococcus sp.]|nr:ATP-binding cassette domain-containing protein [Ruminococcus sp.]
MTLEAHNISKHFGKNGLPTVNISISDNRFVCVTGESGCGKTTLLNILSGMLRPDSGNVRLDGKNIYDMTETERTLLRNGAIGYMAQGNSLIPELTVWQNIVCPIEIYGRKYDKKQVSELIKKLGIDNVSDSYPSDISGGEYRRALLARVISSDAKLLLVDEPTSNLDEKSAHIVREILYEQYKKGKGLLIVTHDSDILGYNPEVIQIVGVEA